MNIELIHTQNKNTQNDKLPIFDTDRNPSATMNRNDQTEDGKKTEAIIPTRASLGATAKTHIQIRHPEGCKL
jgi:hypothetical protein